MRGRSWCAIQLYLLGKTRAEHARRFQICCDVAFFARTQLIKHIQVCVTMGNFSQRGSLTTTQSTALTHTNVHTFSPLYHCRDRHRYNQYPNVLTNPLALTKHETSPLKIWNPDKMAPLCKRNEYFVAQCVAYIRTHAENSKTFWKNSTDRRADAQRTDTSGRVTVRRVLRFSSLATFLLNDREI